MAAVLSSNGGGGGASTVDLEEEAQGLVTSRQTKRFRDSPEASGSSTSSLKCQIVSIFIFTSLFMLTVGYAVGRDSVGSKSETDKGTRPPTEELNGGDGNADGSKMRFDVDQLLSARAKAIDALDMLDKYWSPYSEKVLWGNTGLTFGFQGKDREPTNKDNFKRTVDIVARVLANSDQLTLGFIGSSVMCGHDNCYYDSFPEQLKRFIGPIFQLATGKEIAVRNGCQGGTCGDSYENQIFCFRHMVGDDIDFLFYEWTYFENHNAFIYHETITRWATLLPKVPATFIFNCDGNAWGANGLAEHYAKFGANGINLEAGLKAGPYSGKVWGAIGDGIHNTTRYGQLPDVPETRRNSLGVVFRNWHPGPLGLQYVSDLTSYVILRAAVKAIDEIIAAPNDAAKKWPAEPIEFTPLPPVFFERSIEPDMYELANLNEEPPGCYTIQKSTFGKPQPVIADRSGDLLNPYRDQVRKVNSGPDAWSVWNAAPNWGMVPREERSMGDVCKPTDNCAYFVEPQSGASTPLVFRLPKMTTGLIVLCGNGGDAGKELLDVKGKFKVEFDGKILDKTKFSVFPNKKCLCVQKRFSGTVEDKHGHLYLSISTETPLKISQIITA